MIQPLRNAHSRVFVALALLLPAIIVLGLASRQAPPGAATMRTDVPASATLVMNSPAVWRAHAMRTRFYRDAGRLPELYVEITPAEPLAEPDLLLYWSAGEAVETSLPADARLVGPFTSSQAMALPGEAGGGGTLLLFSLAKQSVVDSAGLEKLP